MERIRGQCRGSQGITSGKEDERFNEVEVVCLTNTTLDDYKKWKNRGEHVVTKLSVELMPLIVILLVVGVGTTIIFTLPPHSAQAGTNLDKGHIILINGDTDSSTPYLVYVDTIKVGQGTLGMGQNITLVVSVPEKYHHTVMISSGTEAITISGIGQDNFPKDLMFMIAPHMEYIALG